MEYKITVVVRAENLGPAITALTPLAVGPIVSAVSGGRKGRTTVPGAREPRRTPIQDTRSGRIVLDALRTGMCTRADIEDALSDAGFSRNTAGPCISKLTSAGFISPNGSLGTWSIVPQK